MLPVIIVEGVGAVEEPMPPVAVAYHNKPVPFAISGLAVAPWQSCTGVVTTGALGRGFTVTTMGTRGLSQLLLRDWLT